MNRKAVKGEPLPEGWHRFSLSNLSTLKISNGIFNDPKKVGSGCKLVNVVNLYTETYINTNELKRLDISKLELKKFKLDKGDLLFTRSSLKLDGIAHCNMYPSDDVNAVYECHTMRVRPKKDIVMPNYLYYFCRSDSARRYLMKQAKTTTMTTIDQAGIGGLPVILPSLGKQRTIVTVLKKWDTAIEKTEALIAAKEQQFKWLLKTLISDQKDKTEWQNTDIRTLLKVIPPPKKIKKIDFLERGKYPIIDQSQRDIAGWFNDEEAVVHSEKPVVIFGDHTCVIKYVSQPFGQGSDGIKILETGNQLIPKFLYFLLMNKPIKTEGYKRHFSKLESRKISLPPLAEQKRIILILNTNQKEIKLTKQLVEQYRTQKRGLMQKLLTGKWRIKA